MLVHLAAESFEEESSARGARMAQERIWSSNGRSYEAFHRLAKGFHPDVKTVRHSATILARILAQPLARRVRFARERLPHFSCADRLQCKAAAQLRRSITRPTYCTIAYLWRNYRSAFVASTFFVC